MKTWRRWLVAVPALVVLLSACDADDEVARQPATQEPEVQQEPEVESEQDPDGDEGAVRSDADLVVWADDLVTEALQPFADDFGARADADVALEEVPFDDLRDRLLTAAPAGDGPDLIIGAHDWLGELVAARAIAPVDLTAVEDQLEEVAVDAFTFDAQTYGLPYATENVALYRNTDLVPEVPATWEELEEIALALQDDGEVRQGVLWPTAPADPYHNYPFVTAYGGYLFGMDEDGLDTSDVGLDRPGSIRAADRFREMISSGLLSPDISAEQMAELFSGGEAAFAITGPWALGDLEGPPFEVTPIPAIDGGTPRPFVGVQGFMLSAVAPNEPLARDFLAEVVATEDVQVELAGAVARPPALTSALGRVADDPNIEGFADAAADGVPLPAIPQTAAIFEVWARAYTQIYEGAQAPEEAFSAAADEIRALLGQG